MSTEENKSLNTIITPSENIYNVLFLSNFKMKSSLFFYIIANLFVCDISNKNIKEHSSAGCYLYHVNGTAVTVQRH